jgi:hypothetical protein
MPKIVCVTPTIRPESMANFRKAWAPLFEKHRVTLITVWDGETPRVEVEPWGGPITGFPDYLGNQTPAHMRDLFCRYTDACRNLGFVAAAKLGADFILTLDDDVAVPKPEPSHDPIQEHLDALSLRVPLSWMNTAHMGAPYLRGVPYDVRDEAPVMLSHGVWVGTPDFDGETQLRLEKCGRCNGTGDEPLTEMGSDPCQNCDDCVGTGKNPNGVPKTLPYYVGPVPRGVLFPLCGMNVMVRREALPYFYFAPMGPDSGFPDLHRFADIFMGVQLKKQFDAEGWACYTGASTVLHTRASDAVRNMEQERLGRQWLEWCSKTKGYEPKSHDPLFSYFNSYFGKRCRYADLIRGLMERVG